LDEPGSENYGLRSKIKQPIQQGLVYGMRGVKKLKTKGSRRIFKSNAENPGRIVKLYASVAKNFNCENSPTKNCEFKFRDSNEITTSDPLVEKREVVFPVFANSQCFKFPDEQTKLDLQDLNGRPGVDDDNDTTESLIQKQIRSVFKNLARGLHRVNRRVDPNQYLNSLPS
jgi:hypothetical protein